MGLDLFFCYLWVSRADLLEFRASPALSKKYLRMRERKIYPLPSVARLYPFSASRGDPARVNSLHPADADQRVWDAAPTRPLCINKDIACKALCVQKHCLPLLGPLQEHTTFNESLVCYTSPGRGALCRMTDIYASAQAHEAGGIVRGHHE